MATQAVADGAVIAPGTMLVGKYRVVRSIGRGGMAQVYEALQLGLGKRVAVKVLNAQYSASPILTERFFREARAASAIKSPYIVDVYDSGRLDDQRPFIVMELLDGESLYERLARKRRLSPEALVRFVTQCSKGLAKAHAAGIVHRDLKPENVFIVHSEEGDEVAKLLDFGLAKFYAATDDDAAVQRLTRDGAVFGTPPYMSPEQVRGQVGVDHRTDLWALGCIVYEALVGKPVWKTDQGVAMIFASIASGELPIPSVENAELPASFDRWFVKALARKSDERFQTALEFSEALRDAFSADEIARVRAESMIAIQARRMNSLNPPPMSKADTERNPAPFSATPVPALAPTLPAQDTRVSPDFTNVPVASPPRMARSEPPPFAVADRRRAGFVRLAAGAFVSVALGTAVAIVLTARQEQGEAPRTPAVDPPAAPPVSTPQPPRREPLVSAAVQELVRSKRFGEAAQEIARTQPSGQGRWLAEAWRRLSPVDTATCAPRAFAALAGEAVAAAGSRLFTITGARGSQHVVSQGLSPEGWLVDEPLVDATPEGLRILAARVVPVGDRFALFVVEGGEDEKAVRLRARPLGPEGAPLGATMIVQSIQGYRHLSEVLLTERDGYIVAFSTESSSGTRSIAALRVERSFEARGKPLNVAQAGAQAGVEFGAPHLGIVGADVLVAYAVTSGGRRAAETQVVRADAPQWGTEGFQQPIEVRGSRRIGPVSRITDRVAFGSELALACGPSRCFIGWEDEARGAYVARLDNVTGALHVQTSLGRGGGRMALAPVAGETDSVQVVSSAGGAVRSVIVSPIGAQPATMLLRSAGPIVEATALSGGLRVLATEGEGGARHALVASTSCR